MTWSRKRRNSRIPSRPLPSARRWLQMKIWRFYFAFAFVMERQKILNLGIFIFFACNCFCGDGMFPNSSPAKKNTMTQEPNRNRKPDRRNRFESKLKAEPEPSELFLRNQNQNRKHARLLKLHRSTEKMWGTLMGGNGFWALFTGRSDVVGYLESDTVLSCKCCAAFVFLEQDKGCRISLAVRCLSVPVLREGHLAVTDPWSVPPTPYPPTKKNPQENHSWKNRPNWKSEQAFLMSEGIQHQVWELETNSASRWEGVRLPQASGKSPDFPGSSPNFPGSFSATSPEVLSPLTLQSLLFLISLLFSFSDFPCFFWAFFLPFPRILGVPRREKPLLFFGVSLVFFKKKQGLEGQGQQSRGSPEVPQNLPRKFPGLPRRSGPFSVERS